jgi:hypothetical protein
MKKIKIVLLIISTLYFISCTEQILDLEPINAIKSDKAFSTPSLIKSSVSGMYNAAAMGQFSFTNTNSGRGYIWGAAFVQQGDNRGEDVVNQQTFYQITYSASYDPGTANNVYYWGDGYRLINRCNLVIDGVKEAVSKGIITQEIANNYIGQAQFLRAITHFELLIHFARPYQHTADASHFGVVYREVGIDTDIEIASELLKGRNSVAECYAKVLADLNDAEKLITETDKKFATKNAAIAFKTRVYLHKRDWQNVITEGLKINSIELTTTPGDPFITTNNLTNTESIFSIAHSATLNPGVNGALASQYKRRQLVCISPIIWRDPSWLQNDKRRFDDSKILSGALNEGSGLVFTSGGRKYTNKYKDGVNYSDAAPVIRQAEVVLNMAEAYARLPSPNLTNALSQLNRVRNRSLETPLTQAYTSATLPTQSAMVGAILKERRIEFLMEGRRWSDIHRLQGDNLHPINGIPAKVLSGAPAASLFTPTTPYTGPFGQVSIPYNDYRFIWPIPQLETNTNPTLKAQQNPGY